MGSVREALEALPGELELGRGGLRVFAQFRDGRLVAAPKIAVFRVPPTALQHHGDRVRGALNLGALEQIAADLHLDEGATELVVEYIDQGDGPRLHWVDFSWNHE